jgi:YVTN family beta-propeller protein
VSSLATTRNGHQRLSRSSRRVRRGTQAAALSLILATGVASLLAAVPAQTADIYTVTAKIGIGVGPYPDSVAVSPDGTRAYIVSTVNDSVSVINTRTGHLTATIHVCRYPAAVAVSLAAPGSTSPTLNRAACR